jgi:hypothetical protein
MIPPVPPACVRRRAVFQLWLANLLLATLVGLNYLAHVPEARGLKVWLFALPALLSSVLTLTLVPAGLFTLAAQFLRSTNLLGTLQAAFWTLFLILLFADTRIYNIFRYHFNGQVWNLLYTRGSEDALHLGWQVWSAIVFGIVLFVALQSWLWRRALKSAQAAFDAPVRRRILSPALLWCIMLPAVFVEKTIYASAHLVRDREITRLARLFPLYAPVPMEDLANKVLGVEPRVPEPVELGGFELDYPLARPELPDGGARPNVLVLVIDCLRRDVLGPEVTPAIARWAEDGGCRRFEDHVSGGNSTRYGLFALFYGLHGSYWFPVLAERRSPVLVDALREQGYDFGIFGSASMNYPELRATLFAALSGQVHDDFPSPHATRPTRTRPAPCPSSPPRLTWTTWR